MWSDSIECINFHSIIINSIWQSMWEIGNSALLATSQHTSAPARCIVFVYIDHLGWKCMKADESVGTRFIIKIHSQTCKYQGRRGVMVSVDNLLHYLRSSNWEECFFLHPRQPVRSPMLNFKADLTFAK